MRKLPFVFIFLMGFVFGQKRYDVDSLLGLKPIQPFEIRIYIKNYMLIKPQDDVLVFKKENNNWNAIFYKIRTDNIRQLSTWKIDLKVSDGNAIWLSMLNNHIDKIPKNISHEYKQEKYIFNGKDFVISEFWTVADGIYYTIIVNNKGKINTIVMKEPWTHYREFPEIDEYKFIADFLLKIEKELSFNFFDMTKSK